MTIRKRFKIGDMVRLTPNALDNYGNPESNGKPFKVTSVSTFYCPASKHYQPGHSQSCAGHPGFDDVGDALYEGDHPLPAAFYDWELERA